MTSGPELFELRRRSVTECRVQPLLVVHRLDDMTDPLLAIQISIVLLQVHLLLLERPHEPLRLGVVSGRPLRAHADPPVRREHAIHIVTAGVLYTLVRGV